MANVYAGSSLNFAATGASNRNFGCFTQRDVKLIQPCKAYLPTQVLIMASTNVLDPSIGCLVWKDHLSHSERGCYKREFLHLERYTLDETNSAGSVQIFLSANLDPSGNRDFMECYDIREESDPLTFWEDLISYYTRCYLTKEDDKLVPLPGLARLIHDLTGDEFVASL